MLAGRASDIKRHAWFEGFDWDALEARKMDPPRRPKGQDATKRIQELTVRARCSVSVVGGSGWSQGLLKGVRSLLTQRALLRLGRHPATPTIHAPQCRRGNAMRSPTRSRRRRWRSARLCSQTSERHAAGGGTAKFHAAARPGDELVHDCPPDTVALFHSRRLHIPSA